MKVILAESAGFCWGVERAIDIARDFAAQGKRPVYTDGPLIHNSQMMEKIEAEGIREVGDYESSGELEIDESTKSSAVMVVRAHGISPERRKYLKSLGMEFRDATCPDVGFIAGKIHKHASKGYKTILFGDPKHPEVIGLMGYTNDCGYVVKSQKDIDALPPLGDKVCMVSQSTMFTDEFERLGEYLKIKYPNAQVIDTICGATKERQTDVVNLVKQGAQAIVVVGGYHSSNTRKLALLVENHGVPAYHVETADDIDVNALQKYEIVGITAGASTPDFIIESVCNKLGLCRELEK